MSMGDPNDPYFSDLRDDKADFPGTTDRPQRGCLFYGCIGVLVMGAVVAILLAILSVFAYRFGSQLVEEYTATEPVPVPVVELPEERVQEIESRVEEFQDLADAGEATTLSLSAEELNALIARNPNLRGRLAVDIEGDQLRGQISFPLEELGVPSAIFGGLKGRYLNGEASLTPILRDDGKIAVRIDELIVKGEPVPEQFMAALRQEDMVLNFESEDSDEGHQFLRRIDRVEIIDGNLVIQTRAVNGDPAPNGDPAIEAPPEPSRPPEPVEPPEPDDARNRQA